MKNSNFKFLESKWAMLAKLGQLAEKNIYSDPNTTIIKLGMFGELMVQFMFAYDDLKEPDENTHANRIKVLKRNDLLPEEIDKIIYTLRIHRNKAVHQYTGTTEDAKVKITLAHKLGVWFMQIYGQWDFEPEVFNMPKETASLEELAALNKSYDNKVKELEEELKKLRDGQSDESMTQRKIQGAKAARKIDLNEPETRKLIDEQLRSCGWEADTDILRYSKGTRPEKGKSIAIAEWPTSSKDKKTGYVDYALFIGLKLVGFIEAKKYSKNVAGNMIESKVYAEGVKEEHSEYVISKWGNYKVPFLFVSNGRDYIKEIKEKSGVHFLDCRNNTNHQKVLQGWYSPEKLENMLKQNIEEANEKLNDLSFDHLKDEDGVSLRYYQVDAIKAVEKAITEGKDTALLTMATGTGKTRTVLGLIYRLLVTHRFKRILFLIDRTALGNQAMDTFQEVKIENLKTLDEIYNINDLTEKLIDKETNIHVATVQAMVKRIMYNGDRKNMPSVGDYDCIIIDEAHRGYILDSEMSDNEVYWRDNKDFLSKYKKVVEYFDAFKVALTATPALHTSLIFGEPVYSYSYRQAVIDGYLVDHEPPHIVKTELLEEGIHYKKGDKVPRYNTYTGELINGAQLKDDMDFNVDQFNKKVIVESFTKTALQDVANYISPYDDGKTLIFAANNEHADAIVRLLKEIYDDLIGGVDDNAIMKITGSIKDPQLQINKFKNDKYPNIAVTVDLLSTGIDVPKIDKIVFMRRVKSRILYEQMLGRATRLCDDINKTHFEIFDCVNLYEALRPVTNMKPVVVDKKESFKILKERLKRSTTKEEKENELDKFIAKLQRKRKILKEDERVIFKQHCDNKTPEEFIKDLKSVNIDEAVRTIIDNNSLIEYLDEKSNSEEMIIISDKKDKLVSHTRGYGKGKRPEDYLQEFRKYIEENKNKILALEIVCTRPEDLTREGLKQLRIILDKSGFSEEYLKTAWNDMSHEEIAADIIAFIRQQALGSPLTSNEERVKKAITKIKREYYFSQQQLKWLTKIENAMLKNTIIDLESFNEGNFRRDGGKKRYNKVFDDNLDEIINKLKTYMFDERGVS